MPTTTDIRKGIAIIHKDQSWLVADAQFVNPGKGTAFTRTKLKNLKSDQTVEHTFRSGEAVELIDAKRLKCQFLYKDGNGFHFMDNESYEQFTLQPEAIGDNDKYLLDGIDCYALNIDGVPVSIQVPAKMVFEVKETTPGVKGDTATGGNKDATLETGLVLKVPLFIKEGEKIIVNTENGEYVSKSN